MPPRAPASTLADRLRPELFQALADPSRLEVLRRLAGAQRPQTVTEIANRCGVHISGVSRHLSVLRRAGFVRAVRQGRQVHHQLDCENVTRTLREIADALDACRPDGCEA